MALLLQAAYAQEPRTTEAEARKVWCDEARLKCFSQKKGELQDCIDKYYSCVEGRSWHIG